VIGGSGIGLQSSHVFGFRVRFFVGRVGFSVGMSLFVCGVRFGFRAFGGGAALHGVWRDLEFLFFFFFGILIALWRVFGLLFLVVVLFFVKLSAANYGVGLRVGLRFFVLGFDKFGGERGDLIFVEIHFTAHRRFRLGDFPCGWEFERACLFRCGFIFASGNASYLSSFFRGCWRRVGYAFFGEKPAGQAAGETPRSYRTRSAGRGDGNRTSLIGRSCV
jgi:hypothetical protein